MNETQRREIEAREAWARANHTAIVEATLELSESASVGIWGSSLENVMEIAAEITEVWVSSPQDPTPVVVGSERFAVYPSGIYYPLN